MDSNEHGEHKEEAINVHTDEGLSAMYKVVAAVIAVAGLGVKIFTQFDFNYTDVLAGAAFIMAQGSANDIEHWLKILAGKK
jgi:hypothetical protein